MSQSQVLQGAQALKNARFALWKNPGDRAERQTATLAGIAKTNARYIARICSRSNFGRCLC